MGALSNVAATPDDFDAIVTSSPLFTAACTGRA